MSYLVIDTEYRNTQERFVTPICAVVSVDGEEFRYWFADGSDQESFRKDWLAWMEESRTIVCYAASAETRCLLSLGFSPAELLSWRWADPFVMWRMLNHSHEDYRWGLKLIKEKDGTVREIETKKPPEGGVYKDQFEETEEGETAVKPAPETYRTVGFGLADAVFHQLGIRIDTLHKAQMRELILSGVEFDEDEKQQILDYCASDIAYVYPLTKRLLGALRRLTVSEFKPEHLYRLSRYMVCTGIVESNGLPWDLERATALGESYHRVVDSAIIDCNKVYPFFVEKKSTKADIRKGHGPYRWVESATAFREYVESTGLGDSWPKSESGLFKKDQDTLKDYEGDHAIYALRSVKKTKKSLNYLRPEGFARIQSRMGRDNRVRVFLNPFGSKTGRNQPSVSDGFLFGMSTWLRPLCSAEGKVIQGGDYSSQEMLLQGYLSGDNRLLEACQSGDPYVWLAKYTKAMPEGVIKSPEGYRDANGDILPKETQIELKGIRSVFKSLMLGIGYGMGLAKLATRLTQSRIEALPADQLDTVRRAKISEDPDLIEEADQILSKARIHKGVDEDGNDEEDIEQSRKASTYSRYHKLTFRKYWNWRAERISEYRNCGFLMLSDGWCLFGDESDTTSGNFPVQGTGSAILRRAIERCILAGLEVIAPLHDAVYIASDPDKVDEDREILVREMEAAVADVLGEPIVKVDAKAYMTDWDTGSSVWCEEKQSKEFAMFSRYMQPKKYK